MAQKLNIDIVARDRTKKALSGVQGALGRLKRSVFSLQTAFLGLGAGLFARNLVNTGKNLENLRTRLKFLLKDTNEGAKAFDNMVKFASRVPFSLEEIQAGSGILATVTDNANDLQNMLEITGNVAAVTGLDFRTASEQIQRSFSAGIGAADLFREKGVRNMLGFKAGATVSIEETVQAFERVFGTNGRFGQATDELANTFEGTLSMIGDKIFNFKKVLLEAGLFEELKRQFGDLDKFLEDNAKQLDEIATSIGKNLAQGMVKVVNVGKDLVPTMQKIGKVLKSISDGFLALPSSVQSVGLIAAFMFGKKGAVGLAAVSIVVDKVLELVDAQKVKRGLVDPANIEQASLRMAELNKQLEDGFKIEEEITRNKFDQEVIIKNFVKLSEQEIDNRNKELQQLERFILTQKAKLSGVFEYQKTLHESLKIHKEMTKETDDLYEAFLRTQQPIHEIAHDMSLVPESVKEAREEYLKTQKARKEAFQDLPEELKKQLEEERIEKIREEGSALENLKENYREFFENFNAGREVADIFFNSLQSVTKGIGDAVAQTIVFGKSFKDTFGNIARNILAQLISSLVQLGVNMVINATIGKKLQASSVASGVASAAALSAAYATPAALASLASFGTNAIPAQSALISTVALSNVLSSVKGFEKGGAVSKGQPILVGERGAEVFVPNQTGQIEQSARGGLGAGAIVNFNITTVDAKGFDDLLVSRRGTISRIINESVNERGREAII